MWSNRICSETIRFKGREVWGENFHPMKRKVIGQIKKICAGYIMKIGVEIQPDDEIPRHANVYKNVKRALLEFSGKGHEDFPPLSELSKSVVELLKKK